MTNSRVPSDERRRILLVDDENSVLHSVYTLLENDGYEILAAQNGRDALAIFRRSIRTIDLLVTDYSMPGVTGLELSRSCSRLNSRLAVLYISGTCPDAELHADLQMRKHGFVPKPFRGDDLLRKARELLAPDFDHDGALSAAAKLQLAAD